MKESYNYNLQWFKWQLSLFSIIFQMLPINILRFHVLNDRERREHIRVYNIERRVMRDNSDPFALRDEQFIRLFRLNKEMVRYVCDEIRPYINETENIVAIPSMLKLLTALDFFATGSYQRCIGQSYNLSVSQPAASNIIREISLAIGELSRDWVKFPQTAEEKNRIKSRFMNRTHFPGVVGAIDCTHIAIIAPQEEEHNYLNRKGFHSKNVQIICDYDLRILNVNAAYAGATHDSFIWRHSVIQEELERWYNLGDRNSWLVGDSGYPQQRYLMTPIVDAPPGTPEFAYTQAQMRARNCVERCIGIWKGTFRCLMAERKLRYKPEKVGQIIIACAVLHHIRISGGLDLDVEEILPEGRDNWEGLNNHNDAGGNQARAELIERYFN